MNRYFYKFIYKYQSANPVLLSVICFILEFVNTIIFSTFAKPVKITAFENITEAIITAVLFAPIIETYFFQQLIIRALLKYFKNKYLLALFISAAVFGLMHWYSIEYIFKTFISGLLFGTLYLLLYNDIFKSFWYVCIVHALFNLLVTFIIYIF